MRNFPEKSKFKNCAKKRLAVNKKICCAGAVPGKLRGAARGQHGGDRARAQNRRVGPGVQHVRPEDLQGSVRIRAADSEILRGALCPVHAHVHVRFGPSSP